MIYNIITAILIIIFALSKNERDACRTNYKKTLIYKLFPNWVKKNKKYVTENLWKQDSWLIKNVLTYNIDYWHFAEMLNVLSYSIVAVIAILRPLGSPWWHFLLFPMVLYGFIGFQHSLLDGSLLRGYKEYVINIDKIKRFIYIKLNFMSKI